MRVFKSPLYIFLAALLINSFFSGCGGGEDKGIVLTLSADPAEQGREAADMAARVIKGESPSAISIEKLIVNLKEATALGFKVPFDILSSATRVIKCN
jgi:hypothetical protein